MTDNFFNPLRRKIGLAILLLSCVLVAMWISGLRGLSSSFDYRVQFEFVNSGIAISAQKPSLMVEMVRQGGGFTNQVTKTWQNWIALTIPYWSLVIPLTVLAAWLLVSHPRRTDIRQSIHKSA